jgi:transposase InsO family protein
VAAPCLRHLIAAVPDTIHTVLTDHGLQCTNRQRDPYACLHRVDRVCQESGSDQRLTKTHHPWTHGPVERLNRTLQEATVNKSHDETHDHLQAHLHAFLLADNFAKRLNTLNGLTPDECIGQGWPHEPERLISNPHHHTLGLNT